jgi:hypothetical protein
MLCKFFAPHSTKKNKTANNNHKQVSCTFHKYDPCLDNIFVYNLNTLFRKHDNNNYVYHILDNSYGINIRHIHDNKLLFSNHHKLRRLTCLKKKMREKIKNAKKFIIFF